MAAPAAAHLDFRGSVYTLGIIALVVSLLGLGLAYAIDAASRDARTPAHRWDSTTTLARSIGGRDLRIPLAWFRNAEGGEENFSRQVDLLIRLPIGPGEAMRSVDVTLVPRSTVRASAQLLDGVYLHMFGADEVAGPPGLVGKPLRAAEGYASETVWYDPLSATPFVAKCDAPGGPAGRGACLRIVYLAPALAAIYRFPADALDGWRSFDEQLNALLGQIGATDI